MRPLPMVGGMLETVVHALGRSDLFSALNEEQRRKVAQRAELLQTGPDEVVMREGDEATTFYLVLNGTLTVHTSAGAEVSSLGPSDVLGEMSMLLGAPRTATVAADGPAVLLAFEAGVFDAMFERIPGFGMGIGRALARRLEAATKKLAP